ncbi:toprim domain-containing protein [Rhodobacter sp. NTK016B]|uniref:toprim domain-containing protein n=1 Tax=Rhodobacter sp. NTK016B TaxID=2759676 RepID=UPI001A8F2E5A|nr:toprim domain-containing protein [Rhodobacter sp. NTK016B]MBN8292835.1 toprim domain-containing protein [Rhodobacter sp. NTK016B]
MSIHDAMTDACRAVGIVPPTRVMPGRWVPTPVEGKGRGNGSGRVKLNPDGESGVCWNWVTGEKLQFTTEGAGGAKRGKRPARDHAAERAQAERRAEVAKTCERIVKACAMEPHPYFARKGFPDERGLVIEDPRHLFPRDDLGEAMARALPETNGPLLVVPGRIRGAVTTIQFIAEDGTKKNILGGAMMGAVHRIAVGPQTWVCEGIATALSVRAALRLLGARVTVLSAFSANNVAKVAKAIPGAIIAADHDRPLEQLGGLGTGEFYARQTGHRWAMPPALGDFNDYHQSEGLRAVALHLRGIGMG